MNANQEYLTLARSYLPWNNPMSKGKLSELFGMLDLQHNATILDIGAGNGAVLALLLDIHPQIRAVFIEQDSDLMQSAQKCLSKAHPHAQIEYLCQDAQSAVQKVSEVISAVLCIGSSHALGGYQRALQVLGARLLPGAMLLAGEGYWKQDPPAEYLSLTGMTASELQCHFQNILAAEACGFDYLYALSASEDDWDRFEGQYSRALSDYLLKYPEPGEVNAFRQRMLNWRSAYLRYGRQTLGFALYLYRLANI